MFVMKYPDSETTKLIVDNMRTLVLERRLILWIIRASK